MKKVFIVGLGQQGSSMAWALRKYDLDQEVYEIIVWDLSPDARQEFKAETENLDLTDITVVEDCSDPRIAQADIIIPAIPESAYEPFFKGLDDNIKNGCIVSDIATVKVEAVKSLREHAPDHVKLVPAHPIAGMAQPGIISASADMYKDAAVIVVEEGTDQGAQGTINKLWTDMGAIPMTMSAECHDEFYGRSLLFVHLVSFALTEYLDGNTKDLKECLLDIVLDMTRISNANPDLWVANITAVKSIMQKVMEEFEQNLDNLENMLRDDNGAETLAATLKDIHETRRDLGDSRAWPHLQSDLVAMSEGHGVSVGKTEGESFEALSNLFNTQSLAEESGKRIALPALIAAALVQTTLQGPHLEGVRVKKAANPSIYGMTASMLSDPEYIENLLQANKKDLLEALPEFKKALRGLADVLENKEELRQKIQKSAKIRDSMFPPRTLEELAGSPYIIQPNDPEEPEMVKKVA